VPAERHRHPNDEESPMASIDAKEARQLLEDERGRLQQIRASVALEGGEGISEEESLGELSLADQHPADVGTETFEREKDLSILDRVDGQLADVEHALERLEDGTYGTCEACGRDIDEDRLRARPAARFCLDDQARVERGVA
jgi:RNA polymerase-binding protein DksA